MCMTIYFYINANSLVCRAKRQKIDPVAHVVITTKEDPTVISLIGNVHQFVATYGVDSNGDKAADYYTQAVNVDVLQWNKVISLQLSLVLKSEDNNLTPTSMPYTVNGNSISTSDKRLYRVFGTSIGMRNLLF